jgi:ATP-dependent exoDNAse (exonuclease V) beta subunit
VLLDLLEKRDIQQLNLPTGRFYAEGDHRLPSVSTILDAISDKTYLNQWKARVGKQNAEFRSQQAKDYGTAFHGAIEEFLLEGKEPTTPQLYAETKEVINLFKKDVKIRAVEYPLISPNLKAAGTVDCICEMNGIPAIVDFKTYGNKLYPDTLVKYQIQAAFYGMMANEMYDLNIGNLIILAKKPHHKLQRIHCLLDKEMENRVWNAVSRYEEKFHA